MADFDPTPKPQQLKPSSLNTDSSSPKLDSRGSAGRTHGSGTIDVIPPEDSGSGGNAPPQPGGGRKVRLIAAGALVAAGLGYLAFGGSNPTPNSDFSIQVITDARVLQDEVNKQADPAVRRQLQAQLDRHDLELWRYSIHGADPLAVGQTYTVDTHLPGQQYTYMLRSDEQQFSLFTAHSANSFGFRADSNPTRAAMAGYWHTLAGTQHYDMKPGQSEEVPAR